MNKPQGGKMNFESLLTLLKNFDFKYIISELKKLRKGAMMIMFVICLCCAAFDFVLRKFGIVFHWFTHLYLIIGFFTICIYSVKVFNRIADIVDSKKAIMEKYRQLKPVLENIKPDEVHILKKFVQDNLCKTVFSDEYLKKINNDMEVINTIFKRFKPFGYTIKQCAHVPEFIFEIDREFFEILKIHFKS